VSIQDNDNQGKQPLMGIPGFFLFLTPILGDALALGSAVAYGVYTVYLRKSTDGKEVSMAMMLGKLSRRGGKGKG
jgi:drug/metabolite transporter (DMT)-like permease